MKYFFIVLALLSAPAVALAYPGNFTPENVGLYNFSTISLTTASTQIVARNPNRNLLIIENTGATNGAIIKPGSAPTSSSNGITLAAGAIFMPEPAMVDAFYAESETSTTTLTIIEGIK